MNAICPADECVDPVSRGAYCSKHYMRHYRHGSTADRPQKKPVADRLLCKFEQGDGCWLWTAALDRHGYGAFGVDAGKVLRAHRAVYELLVGPIPEGLVLDHLCRVPACVRPDHLEPVEQAENLRRGVWKRSKPDLCVHGHAMQGRNIIVKKSGGWDCRTCSNEAARRYYHRKTA